MLSSTRISHAYPPAHGLGGQPPNPKETEPSWGSARQKEGVQEPLRLSFPHKWDETLA